MDAMRKLRIKGGWVVIAIWLAISFGTSVSREPERRRAPERAFLESAGTPAAVVEQLPDDAVYTLYRALYEESPVYLAADSGAAALGDLRTNDLMLWVLPYRVGADGDALSVHIVYVWQRNPMVKRIDAVACNWDASRFELGESTGDFHAESRYYDTIRRQARLFRAEAAPAKAAFGGLGWYVPVPDFTTGMCGVSGSASFRLVPKEPLLDRDFQTALRAEYVHAENPMLLGPAPALRADDTGVQAVSGALTSRQEQTAALQW